MLTEMHLKGFMVVLYLNLLSAKHARRKSGLTTDRKIVGGVYTQAENFPFIVSIRKNNIHLCGGAIVSSNTVLTSAHCFIFKATDVANVVVGEASASPDHIPQSQNVYNTDWAQGYPGHNTTWPFVRHDIAIIRIVGNFLFGPAVQPIALGEFDVPVGTTVTVVGYGYAGMTHNDEYRKGKVKTEEENEKLRTAKTQIMSTELCQQAVYKHASMISNEVICTNYPYGGLGVCFGDSGGPLIYQGKLIGITSWVIACGDGRLPEVFVKVTKYLDWIRFWINHQ